jgi:hypothetical protein
MNLDMAKFAPGGGDSTAAVGLTIEANIKNCDIDVDGKFVGSTPWPLQPKSTANSIQSNI